jgi:hypothetical protein
VKEKHRANNHNKSLTDISSHYEVKTMFRLSNRAAVIDAETKLNQLLNQIDFDTVISTSKSFIYFCLLVCFLFISAKFHLFVCLFVCLFAFCFRQVSFIFCLFVCF